VSIGSFFSPHPVEVNVVEVVVNIIQGSVATQKVLDGLTMHLALANVLHVPKL